MRRAFLIFDLTSASLLIAAVLLLLAGCSASTATSQGPGEKGDKAAVAPALTVTAAPVTTGNAETTISATGTISAWQEVVVSAETSGLAIVDVAVEEGEEVSKGQVLARLNDALLKAQIAEQEAVVRESQASVGKAGSANRRAQTLVARKAVSEETAENARTDLETARAKLAQAEAALEELKVQLTRTQILAPVDGYVSEPPVVIGTVVQNGTELFHIIRDSRLELAAKLPEQYLSEIGVGQHVEVTDAAGRTVTATVRGVAAQVDRATRLGTVYIVLPEGSALRPGMFARAVIATRSETVLNIPQSALVWRDGGPRVFVLGDDDVVAIRAVETGSRSGSEVAITSGLTAGERIVTSGAGLLNDGNMVRVAANAADAGPSTQQGAAR